MRRLSYLFFFSFAFFIVLFATPLGLGLNPDAVSYLKGASGLINGRGFDYVSSQWPPLYPLLVALFGLPSGDVILSARILNAIFFAINFVLIAELTGRVTNAKLWLVLILAGAISIQSPMMYVHFYAWSEPCLLTCILVNLLLLSKLNTIQNQMLIQGLLIFVACIAFLTRFAGIIVAVTNCVMIFLMAIERSLWLRIRQTLLQFLIPILVFLPWTSHQGISDGPATARIIEFHPITLSTINKGLMIVGRWLNPLAPPGYNQPVNTFQLLSGALLLIIITIIIGWFFLKLFSKPREGLEKAGVILRNQTTLIIFSSSILIQTYIFFLVAALSFVDNKVELDNRILVLIYPALMLTLIGVVYKIRIITLRNTLIIIFILMMSLTLHSLKGWLLLSRYGGIEMNSRGITTSPLQVFIKSCQKDLQIYADNPWNFDLSFDRKVLWLPSKTLYNSGRANTAYDNELDDALSNAQLIIIENKNEEQISKIDQNDQFLRIKDNLDGVVWVNKKNQGVCIN